MLTFHAAFARKDSKGYPSAGFQMENALTREETLKGMTIWAAYSNFEEKKGSLEVGKWADFVLFDKDIMKIERKFKNETHEYLFKRHESQVNR
jgi:predicted amidohydrolase YtcJ